MSHVQTDLSISEVTLLALTDAQPALEKPAYVTIGKPKTDYKIDLVLKGDADSFTVGKPITGRIKGRVRRVDLMKAGGRFVEPVYGRPRRLQGRVIQVDNRDNTLIIDFGLPVTCQLVMNQYAGDFPENSIVACDLERGASFEIV